MKLNLASCTGVFSLWQYFHSGLSPCALAVVHSSTHSMVGPTIRQAILAGAAMLSLVEKADSADCSEGLLDCTVRA